MSDTSAAGPSGFEPDLADEYVLGLLDPAEQARAERLAEQDPAFRAAVAASRDRFVELDLLAAPATVSDGLWERIAAGLGVQSAESARDAAPVAGTIPPPVNDNRVKGWRLAAFAGLAASLLLAASLAASLRFQPEPMVIAVLLDDAGEPLVLVEDYGNASARITPLTEFDVPEGRTMQVWTLPSQEMGPVSLGLLETSEATLLDGPVLPQPQETQLYEITIEQEGGSPTGRPTGPILVKGFAKLPR